MHRAAPGPEPREDRTNKRNAPTERTSEGAVGRKEGRWRRWMSKPRLGFAARPCHFRQYSVVNSSAVMGHCGSAPGPASGTAEVSRHTGPLRNFTFP